MLMLRPEQVVLDDAGLPARVLGFTFYGHDAMLALGMGADGTGSRIAVRVPRGITPRVGDVVGVRVAGDAVAYSDAELVSPTVAANIGTPTTTMGGSRFI